VKIPLSGRVPGRASGPSRSRVDDGGGLQYISWKSVWGLRVFSTKGIYMQKGDVRRGWPAPPNGAAASRLLSVSPLDSIFVSGK
jgi:hypothetical protein